jgi:putative chitinase
MLISVEALNTLIGPDLALDWFDPLNAAAEGYEIDTPERISAWLGQLMQESAKFRVLEENLNYSSDALMRVFSKYFTPAEAMSFAHRPQDIANRVYANRLGNGDTTSGDGWRYRGRGLIQITGKQNYQAVSKAFNYDFTQDPNAMLEMTWAALSAAWYWSEHGCNDLADAKDYKGITLKVNGGTNGLQNRIAYTQQAASVLTA